MTYYIVLGRMYEGEEWEYLGETRDIAQPESAIQSLLKDKQRSFKEAIVYWDQFKVLPIGTDEDGNKLEYREDELELEEL